jgi:hypothetical protein
MPETMQANMALTVMMRKLSDTVTGNVLDYLRKAVYIKDSIKLIDGRISSDTLEIDGVKGGQITRKKDLESGQIVYQLLIQLYLEDNLIQLIYGVGAPTEKEARSVFNQEEPMFLALAKRTKFYP